MKQVVVIHGGETFDTKEQYLAWLAAYEVSLEKIQTRRWKSELPKTLGDEYEVIQPGMPNAFDAKYAEWRMWFEKYLPLLEEKLIFIGHSLGASFLAKYLAENDIAKDVLGTFLVGAAYYEEGCPYPVADFALPESLQKFADQSRIIHFYHSTDDELVPFTDLAKFQKKLPYARASVFSDRGHFRGEEFPELVADIKALG